MEYQRVQTLVGKGAVSRSQYDQKEAEYKVAIATLELNKAQLERLKREFDYTEIKAPFNGYISQRNIDKGDRISNTDSTPMFKLIRTNELRVVVDVPQSQLFSIKNNAYAYISFAARHGG